MSATEAPRSTIPRQAPATLLVHAHEPLSEGARRAGLPSFRATRESTENPIAQRAEIQLGL